MRGLGTETQPRIWAAVTKRFCHAGGEGTPHPCFLCVGNPIVAMFLCVLFKAYLFSFAVNAESKDILFSLELLGIPNAGVAVAALRRGHPGSHGPSCFAGRLPGPALRDASPSPGPPAGWRKLSWPSALLCSPEAQPNRLFQRLWEGAGVTA